MKRLMVSVAIFCMAGILGVSSSYAGLSPEEILLRADESRGNLKGVQWRLHIHSLEDGRVQNRTIDVKARGYDFLAIMIAPPKVKGNKVLFKDHNMWFAKPGVRKPVPISARQKLVGQAAYGDIAATNYAGDYSPKILGEETVEGEVCYVFDLKAATKKVTYDRIMYWISKSRYVGVRADYFTVSGKKFKSATFEYDKEIDTSSGQRPFISKMTISDALVAGNVTTMKFGDPRLVQLPNSVFDLNLLMRR